MDSAFFFEGIFESVFFTMCLEGNDQKGGGDKN